MNLINQIILPMTGYNQDYKQIIYQPNQGKHMHILLARHCEIKEAYTIRPTHHAKSKILQKMKRGVGSISHHGLISYIKQIRQNWLGDTQKTWLLLQATEK